MNLTNQPVYRKGVKRKSRGKARKATAQERRHWERVRALGCIVGSLLCSGRITIHHCGTRRGGRKDHMKVIPLCWEHHVGRLGVDGKRLSFPEWQTTYGSEESLLRRVDRRLEAL